MSYERGALYYACREQINTPRYDVSVTLTPSYYLRHQRRHRCRHYATIVLRHITIYWYRLLFDYAADYRVITYAAPQADYFSHLRHTAA